MESSTDQRTTRRGLVSPLSSPHGAYVDFDNQKADEAVQRWLEPEASSSPQQQHPVSKGLSPRARRKRPDPVVVSPELPIAKNISTSNGPSSVSTWSPSSAGEEQQQQQRFNPSSSGATRAHRLLKERMRKQRAMHLIEQQQLYLQKTETNSQQKIDPPTGIDPSAHLRPDGTSRLLESSHDTMILQQQEEDHRNHQMYQKKTIEKLTTARSLRRKRAAQSKNTPPEIYTNQVASHDPSIPRPFKDKSDTLRRVMALTNPPPPPPSPPPRHAAQVSPVHKQGATFRFRIVPTENLMETRKLQSQRHVAMQRNEVMLDNTNSKMTSSSSSKLQANTGPSLGNMKAFIAHTQEEFDERRVQVRDDREETSQKRSSPPPRLAIAPSTTLPTVPTTTQTNRIQLHIYDLIAQETMLQLAFGCHFPIGQCFKAVNSGLHELGTGAYHVGIEVNGVEYAYGANNIPGQTGVFSCMPKHSPGYQYRTTIDLGNRQPSALKRGKAYCRRGDAPMMMEADHSTRILAGMAAEYLGMDYDLLRRNCCSFAHDASMRLGVPEHEIPSWFRNLADAGAVTQDTANSTMLPFTRAFSTCPTINGFSESCMISDAGFEVIADDINDEIVATTPGTKPTIEAQ